MRLRDEKRTFIFVHNMDAGNLYAFSQFRIPCKYIGQIETHSKRWFKLSIHLSKQHIFIFEYYIHIQKSEKTKIGQDKNEYSIEKYISQFYIVSLFNL